MGVVCNFFVICVSFVIISIGHARNTDFSRHRVVLPTVYHARTRREIHSTKQTNSFHHPEVTMKVKIDDEDYVLDLRLNEDLVTDNHVLSYQRGGRTVMHRPTRKELDLCQYSGEVRGRSGSWAALSTCHGVRGVLYDGLRMRYIEPAGHGNDGIQSPHYVYDHADLNAEQSCGHVANNEENDPLQKHLREQEMDRNKANRYKREVDEDMIVRGPFNANELSRYVELVLVADNSQYKASGEDIHTVHRQMKDITNIINSLYTPLNVFVALVGVVVWSEHDEIAIDEDGDTTLANFLRYRKMQLLSNISNDNAHLITSQIFKGGVLTKALKGPICTAEYSGGVSTNNSSVTGLLATTIAHSMGHNFGMEHDNEDCTCPDERCIMTPFVNTSIAPVHWSSCSLRSLVVAFERGMDYCLRNKPNRLFGSTTCGNGFVEPDEQCDCGLMTDQTERNACHACCEPSTCLLRHEATCATGACCDLQTCRPKPAGAVCRAADKECDLPEYCTGHSEFCPRDVYKMDSTPCGKNEAYCYHGWCRSHTDRCRLLWGSTGKNSPDRCYNKNNIKGNRRGNCGYDLLRQTYKPCAAEDAPCGLLQCTHQNERLEFGLESVAILSSTFINFNGTIEVCRTAIIDLGLSDVDPGLVPDGAKCGEDKMCVKQKCILVEEIRSEIRRKDSSVCPSDCSGHGVCNSEGHCHCEQGFVQPLCTPAPAPSVDSGSPTGNLATYKHRLQT